MADKVLSALGIEPCKVEGRRITDHQTLDVVTMVYAGLCNKRVTSLLQKWGVNAMGLAGCDGDVIRAQRRGPKLIGGTPVDFGEVGDVTPESVNVSLLRKLVEMGITPVLSAINHDGKGALLNTNADTVASAIASALGADLIVCFEKNGVLQDKDNPNSVIESMDRELFSRMKEEGSVADGMIPKLENAFSAIARGAHSVTIRNSDNITMPGGTLIR